MLKNYLITTIRTYFTRKGGQKGRPFFTYINLLGLIIGLAAFLIIAHLVRYELSYDSFIPNAENVYRVVVEKVEDGQVTMRSAKTYPGVGNILKNEVQEVDRFARVLKEECMLHYKEEDIKFNRQLTYWADKSLADILGLQFIEEGDLSLLDKPWAAIMSRSAAERYFGTDWEGDKTPIGKTIWLNESLGFGVQGVFEDLPPNSHMEVDFIVSYATLITLAGPDYDNAMPPFYNPNYTYVSLKAGSSEEKVEQLVQRSLSGKIPETATRDVSYNFSLQPVRSIHLNSNLTDELGPNGNKVFVIAMSLAAVLILVVAWINFINLSTARAMDRAKEVGVRKAIGSTKGQLVTQFVFESLFASVLAAIGAVILVFFVSDEIESMAGISSSVFSWEGSGNSWLLFVLIMVMGGLISSIYPAVLLSSIKTVEVLKGKVSGTYGKGYLRKSLIAFQFFFAIFLLTATGAIYFQVNYMRNQSLGMNAEQVFVLHSPRSLIGNEKRVQYFENFRERLLQYPNIIYVGSSACIPGETFLRHSENVKQDRDATGKNLSYDIASVDEGYLPALGFKLIEGRNFVKQDGEEEKMIINETAARVLGFEDNKEALGRVIQIDDNYKYQVIGVVNDAHYEGLQKPIRPLLLLYGHHYEFGYFSAKIYPENIHETVARVQNTWEEIYPNDPFDYFFLDSFFDQQYRSDRIFGKVFGLFSFLAILIACLGLIGLVSFTTYRKTKEIGIRKVMGANVPSIVALLTGEFFKPIIIACLVAIPVSHYIVLRWLDTFAYRFEFSVWMHLIPLVLINVLAFLTISWQSIKAARGNPIKAIREE